MSHHYSGPDYGFPQGDARLDLTDLYAFPKPGAAGRSVGWMTTSTTSCRSVPGECVIACRPAVFARAGPKWGPTAAMNHKPAPAAGKRL